MFSAAALALVVLAGAAIGATSIGGVLVVPALTTLAGLSVYEAIPASSFAFLIAAVVYLAAHARGAVADARRVAPLHAGALIGALLGAALVPHVPALWVRLWVSALALISGVHALVAPPPAADVEAVASRSLPVIGVAVGAGSALSGTGGPVMLLPLLLLLRWPLPRAVLAAQGVQVPVALAASTVHAAGGRLDVTLGIAIGLALAVGMAGGQRLARAAAVGTLRRGTALVLIATGLWYAIH